MNMGRPAWSYCCIVCAQKSPDIVPRGSPPPPTYRPGSAHRFRKASIANLGAMFEQAGMWIWHESVPEDILVTVAEVEPVLPVSEHVQREQHCVEVPPLIDDDLTRLLLPLVTALHADDVPNWITSRGLPVVRCKVHAKALVIRRIEQELGVCSWEVVRVEVDNLCPLALDNALSLELIVFLPCRIAIATGGLDELRIEHLQL
jgi:hypothetical protein